MSLFFWRKNRVIDEFAHQLADEVFSQIKPETARAFLAQETDDVSPNKQQQTKQNITRTLNNAIMRVHQFRELHRLGIYGKARLHLTFTERLKELGYDEPSAAEINKLILLRTP